MWGIHQGDRVSWTKIYLENNWLINVVNYMCVKKNGNNVKLNEDKETADNCLKSKK